VNIFEKMVYDDLIMHNFNDGTYFGVYPWQPMTFSEKLQCYIIDVHCLNCAKNATIAVGKVDRGVFDYYCDCHSVTRHIIYEPLW
jgi:hypothetical protein